MNARLTPEQMAAMAARYGIKDHTQPKMATRTPPSTDDKVLPLWERAMSTGYTMAGLGRVLGIAPESVSQWMRKGKPIPANRANALARALSMTVDEIIAMHGPLSYQGRNSTNLLTQRAIERGYPSLAAWGRRCKFHRVGVMEWARKHRPIPPQHYQIIKDTLGLTFDDLLREGFVKPKNKLYENLYRNGFSTWAHMAREIGISEISAHKLTDRRRACGLGHAELIAKALGMSVPELDPYMALGVTVREKYGLPPMSEADVYRYYTSRNLERR